MPTLASVHSKQATIHVEVQPLHPESASDMASHGLQAAEPLLLNHSQLHLLLCPWQGPLQHTLKAIAGNARAAQAFGMCLRNMFPHIEAAFAGSTMLA